MTDKIELIALASAVEKLEGPCREMDARIAAVLRIGTEHDWALKYPAWIGDKNGRVHLEKNGPSFTAPTFTASIDTALTLLPFDYDWQVNNFDGVTTDYDGHLDNSRPYRACVGGDIEVDHHTPAIALVAAALQARAEATAITALMEGEGK